MIYRATLALLLLSLSSLSLAGDVVRWVDQDGIVHFTDPSYAPHAEVVNIPRANGMDVPQGGAPKSQTRPKFIKIAKAPKRNKRGWRGHRGRAHRPVHHR